MKASPRTPQEIEEALNRLSGEYDYYCGVTSQKMAEMANGIDEQIAKELGWRGRGVARGAMHYAQIETETAYRSKIKALYWALGKGEL